MMGASQIKILSPSGIALKFGGKPVYRAGGTVTVTVVNSSTWASVDRRVYTVLHGSDVVIPVTWLENSDYSCVSATNASITANGIEIANITRNITVELTDCKYKVSVVNDDAEGIASVVPVYSFASIGSPSVFTVCMNQGYAYDGIEASEGTISANGELTVTAASANTEVRLSPRLVSIDFRNTIHWIANRSEIYKARYNTSIDIPLTFLDGADYTCISPPTQCVLTSDRLVYSDVKQDIVTTITPRKVQVKPNLATEKVTGISPLAAYVNPGSNASFAVTYASGYGESDVWVWPGTLSGTTASIPTSYSNYYLSPDVTDSSITIQIGEVIPTNLAYIPLYLDDTYSCSEQLFLPNEIDRNGYIRKISFYLVSGNPATRTVDLYMKHTSLTKLGYKNEWQTVTSSNLVFNGPVTFISGQWSTITLDQPFLYNGTSTLLVVMNDVTGEWSSGDRKFAGFDTMNMYGSYHNSTDWRKLDPSTAITTVWGSETRNCIKLEISKP